MEVEQRDDFEAHYYYDYHEERRERQEQIRLNRILEREERQRELESTLTFKFRSMPMEDQLAMIGGVVSIIVLVILGMVFKSQLYNESSSCKKSASVEFLVAEAE